MAVENGEWIMRGPDRDDPACIRSWEALADWIDQVGFLPLWQILRQKSRLHLPQMVPSFCQLAAGRL